MTKKSRTRRKIYRAIKAEFRKHLKVEMELHQDMLMYGVSAHVVRGGFKVRIDPTCIKQEYAAGKVLSYETIFTNPEGMTLDGLVYDFLKDKTNEFKSEVIESLGFKEYKGAYRFN